MSLILLLSMSHNSFPFICKHVSFRRYSDINIYDFKNDESYIIDDEAYALLKLLNGKKSLKQVIESFPIEKQEEVREVVDNFQELGLIDFSPHEINDNKSLMKLYDNLPEKNPFSAPYLKNLMINLTEKCNLTCKHCYITNKNLVDFPLEKVKDIINEFYELQGIKVILTGGEPYLYPNLKELLTYLLDIPIQKLMLTNGTLIKEKPELLDLLEQNYFDMYVSIDGLENTHNDFRNANCFQDSIDGIKLLLDNNITTSINTMIHKQNLTEFDEMLQLINSLGKIKNWSIDIPTFEASMSKEIREKYEISFEEGGKILRDYGWGVIYESETNNYACGPNLMAIDVLGVVTKCGFFYEQNVGNVLDLGVLKSWKYIQEKLNWPLESLQCNEINCEFLEQCRGGCRYRAFIHSNDLHGIDSFTCYKFGKMK